MELKRHIWLLAIVALLFSLLPGLAAAGPNVQEGQNLLVNPGFEGGWHDLSRGCSAKDIYKVAVIGLCLQRGNLPVQN